MDSFLPYLGPLISLIGIGVAILIAFWVNSRLKKKELTYMVLAEEPLFSVKQEIKDRIKITLDEKDVKALSFVLIRVRNSGRIPIEVAHFTEPLRLKFAEVVTVISADMVNAVPDDLSVRHVIGDGEVIIEPLLLNNGDAFEVKVLLEGENPQILVSGRIVGVKEIRKVNSESPSLWMVWIDMLTVILAMVSTVATVLLVGLRSTFFNVYLLAGLVSLVALILLTLHSRRRR